MALAVRGGGRGGSGDTIARDTGRGGATPLAECSEFMDAFRRRAGVPARDSRPFEGLPLKELREGALMLNAEGERSTAGL